MMWQAVCCFRVYISVKISEYHVPAGPFHLTHDTVGGWGRYNSKECRKGEECNALFVMKQNF